jgi:hypothetical protein
MLFGEGDDVFMLFGEGDDVPKEEISKKIADAVRENPDMPVTLRCNAGDVYVYQDLGTADDSPDGADFNRKRDFDILQKLDADRKPRTPKAPRVLVLAPTRELAAQIHESFGDYGRFLGIKRAVVYGGVGKKPQIDAITPGLDVLVATPGRLLDLPGAEQFLQFRFFAIQFLEQKCIIKSM